MIILGTLNDTEWFYSCNGEFIEGGVLSAKQGESFRDGVLKNNISYVYCTSGETKYIEIINCENRDSPHKIGRFDLQTNDSVWDMDVDQNTLYLLTSYRGANLTFYIIDVTDPANPSFTGKYEEADNDAFLKGFAVYSNYCYMFTDKGFKILNLVIKSAPVLVSTSSLDGYFIEESGGKLYLYCSIVEGYSISSELRVYSLINKENPVYLGKLGSYDFEHLGMAVQDKYVYTFGSSSIKVGDFTNPNNPSKTDNYNYPEAFLDFDPTGIVRAIATTENCLIASGEALFEFNTEKPGQIKRTKKLEFGDYYCQYLGAENDLIVSVSTSYLHVFTLEPSPAISKATIIGLSITGGVMLLVSIVIVIRKQKAHRKKEIEEIL